MARPLRIEFPGTLYHVTSRGNARSEIFLERNDRLLFFSILEKLFPFLQKKAGCTEFPRAQRFALRPPLDKVFPGGQSKTSRNKAIATAHIEHGYSQKTIAAQLGLHSATVSRIIKKERDKLKNKT